jgi:phosphinothricin acetyltransferase
MSDLSAINDIYNHYILNTAITFDIDPKSVADRREWGASLGDQGPYQCFVATTEEKLLGWACSGAYRPKAAYRTSVEASIYLDPDAGGRGVGTLLYAALFDALKNEDVHRVLAAITHPNEASVALHRNFGFSDIGLFEEVGRKFEKYWDVLWMEKKL